MKNGGHVDTTDLAAYCEKPEADEYRSIRLHLAICPSCRNRVQALNALEDRLREMLFRPKTFTTQDKDESPQTGTQGAEDLKAALHYAAHAPAMRRVLSENEAKPEAPSPRGSQGGFFDKLKRSLSFRMPLRLTGPATVVVAAVLYVLALMSVNTPTVVHFQENPVIQFTPADQAPGIGFFKRAREKAAPYDGISVELAGKEGIALSWPPVAQARGYTLRLREFKDGQEIVLTERDINKPALLLKGITLEIGRRYAWTLSGRTEAGEHFSASGGFVLSKGKG